MGSLRFMQRLMRDAPGKLSSVLGIGTRPTHWLTMADRDSRAPRSVSVSLYQVDGRTYVIDILASKGKGWSRRMCVPGNGTLSAWRTDTPVTLTEVTDVGMKHLVVIACAAATPRMLLALGERIARDDVPEGLAAAVPHVVVFEVRRG
jgi:hypothetical protein